MAVSFQTDGEFDQNPGNTQINEKAPILKQILAEF